MRRPKTTSTFVVLPHGRVIELVTPNHSHWYGTKEAFERFEPKHGPVTRVAFEEGKDE